MNRVLKEQSYSELSNLLDDGIDDAKKLKRRREKQFKVAEKKGRSDLITPFVPASELSNWFVVQMPEKRVISEFHSIDDAVKCSMQKCRMCGKQKRYRVFRLNWVLTHCEAN